jgi:hypothetical protein
MTFRVWINGNYDMLMDKVRLISSEQDADDLFMCVVEQLLKNEHKIDEIEDNQKLYYFIRVIKNNYNSKTSPYHYQYRKNQHYHQTLYEDITDTIADEPYKETIPDMIWVENKLNELEWWERDIFLLWVELGTLTKVSEQTKIPINSVGRYINKIKIKLRKLWLEERQN